MTFFTQSDFPNNLSKFFTLVPKHPINIFKNSLETNVVEFIRHAI